MQTPPIDDLNPGDFMVLLPRPSCPTSVLRDPEQPLLVKYENVGQLHGVPFLIETCQPPLVVGGFLQNNGTFAGPCVLDLRSSSYMRLQPEYIPAYLRFTPGAIETLNQFLHTRDLPIVPFDTIQERAKSKRVEDFLRRAFSSEGPRHDTDRDPPSSVSP